MGITPQPPGFVLHDLLQLQGYKLTGTGAGFWVLMNNVYIDKETCNDVDRVLSSTQAVVMGLTLAGYEVEHLLLSMKDVAPAKLLDINLPDMTYQILDYAPSEGRSYWYWRTGMEWQTSTQSPSGDIPFIPMEALVALTITFRERGRLQTGEYTYAVDLNGLASVTVPRTDPLQYSITIFAPEQPDHLPVYTMRDLVDALEPQLGELLFWLMDVLHARWLAVDDAPTGMLHSFSPDQLEDSLTHMPDGKPNLWGCTYQLSAADTKIVEGCREVWQYLQSLDFNTYYHTLTTVSTSTVLGQVRDYLRARGDLKFSIVPSRAKTLQFGQIIRRKALEVHGEKLPKDMIHQLFNLPWASLLMLMHNLYIIDMLSGVTVDESTQVIAHRPDISGFYESVDGLVTVQINQAADYIFGFMQERIPRSIHDPTTPDTFRIHDINYYDIDGGAFYYYKGVLPTIPAPFSIVEEDIEDGTPLLLRWTLSNGRQLVLSRYDDSPVLPDETLNGLPRAADDTLPESVEVFILAQRAPLCPTDQVALDDAVSIIKAYLQAFHGAILLPPDPTQQAVWLLELRRALQAFIVTNASLAHLAENDQLPLVRFSLREKLQWTALEVSETDSRTLYLAFLEVMQYYSQGDLQPLYRFILDVTGITAEEVNVVLGKEETAALAHGDYTYEFRLLTIGTGVTVLIGTVGAAMLGVEVRRIANEGSPPDVLWNAYYWGLFESGGLALGASAKFNVKDILEEAVKGRGASRANWSKLYARVQWEPDDFAGLMTIYSVGASAAYYVGLQISFDSRTTFFEVNKGLESGYGRLISRTTARSIQDVWDSLDWTVGVGASITATLGFTILAPVPYFGNVSEQGIFEPMIAASSYISELPDSGGAVHFAVDDDRLNSDGQALIKRLAARFRPYFLSPITRLEIHGHASPRGSDQYNLDLSARRAQGVYNYLYAVLGDVFAIPTHHTLVIGHGEFNARYLGDIPNGAEVAEWRRVDVLLNGIVICSVFGEKSDS